MAKHIDPALRSKVLEEIKNGTKVSEASAKHSVTTNTIYGWLKHQAEGLGVTTAELAKLRRENAELKELIGIFALEKKRGEKNRRAS